MDPDIALTLPFPRFTRLKKKIHSHWEKKRKKYNMHTSRLYEGITRELRSSNNILQISSLFK